MKSYSIFLVFGSSENAYLWRGQYSSEKELVFATNVMNHYTSNYTVVMEGQENADFWEVFPKKEGYLVSTGPRTYPRLFQYFSMHSIEEVYPYCQDSLNKNDVFILDTQNTIYVWKYNNKSSTFPDKDMRPVLELALEYLQSGGKTCPVFYVCGGNAFEPLEFTTHFFAWNPTPKNKIELVQVKEILEALDKTYSYQDLSTGNFPPGLDTSQLEKYLSEQEFNDVFGVTREEFSEVPKWRQQQIKKEKNLY
uniref:HP domain-containing protein n=1 Tax=Arcella intermedia TaxID=1963864 RepID=A0A6B2LE05_9EUKA